MRRVISKLWWGRYSLPRAFWGFLVLGSILVPLLAMIVFAIVRGMELRGPGYLLFFALIWTYAAVVSVGVWRSANNYAGRLGWDFFAKGFVVLYAGWILWKMLTGGFELFMRAAVS